MQTVKLNNGIDMPLLADGSPETSSIHHDDVSIGSRYLGIYPVGVHPRQYSR